MKDYRDGEVSGPSFIPGEVIGGYEDKGDIFVEVVLAESGYLNQATPQVGYFPTVLEKWHNDKVWEGKVQNAHPSKNHPLIYEDRPGNDKSVAEKVAHYIDKSAKWGFGNYIKTKLTTLTDGINKRLSGIFRITDPGAKQAWREGKYPKYNSSSVYILSRDDKTGLITEAIPIASTSVENPANPLDVAAIQNECVSSDDSCVTKLAESEKSDHNCLYCRYTVLSNFKNKFSSNSIGNVSESSMVDDNSPSTTIEAVTTVSDEITSAEGKPLVENKEKKNNEEVTDYKTLAESLQKELKDTKGKLKTESDKNLDNSKEITQIKKDKLESKIREKLATVPMFAFENKEENKEEVVKKYMKKFGKLEEKEILEDVEAEFHLAHKLLTIQQKQTATKKIEVAESSRSLITNDGKLNVSEDELNESGAAKSRSSIHRITEVFG